MKEQRQWRQASRDRPVTSHIRTASRDNTHMTSRSPLNRWRHQFFPITWGSTKWHRNSYDLLTFDLVTYIFLSSANIAGSQTQKHSHASALLVQLFGSILVQLCVYMHQWWKYLQNYFMCIWARFKFMEVNSGRLSTQGQIH